MKYLHVSHNKTNMACFNYLYEDMVKLISCTSTWTNILTKSEIQIVTSLTHITLCIASTDLYCLYIYTVEDTCSWY